MISVKNLKKQYGDVQALCDVSFEVNSGEIVGLLGHNGAGKTTIMKILTGFIEPTEGTATIGSKDVLKERLEVQQQIGYMPENAPIYPEMLVQEYLLMMAELRQIPKDERKKAVIEAAKSTRIDHLLVRPISTLSKGFRQRVGLCQAILHKPAVLILDEPTNGLDPLQIVEIRELIKQLAKDSTVILSTHILSEIEAVCDRVVILIDGFLAKDSPLDELLSSNEIQLSLSKKAQDAEKELKAVEGIETATKLETDPRVKGYDLWSLRCDKDANPIPQIARLASSKEWDLAEISSSFASLEHVFKELMMEHAAKQKDSGKEEDAA